MIANVERGRELGEEIFISQDDDGLNVKRKLRVERRREVERFLAIPCERKAADGEDGHDGCAEGNLVCSKARQLGVRRQIELLRYPIEHRDFVNQI